MGDSRLKVLAEARRILEEQEVSVVDRDTLFKLLDILTLAVEKHLPDQTDQLPTLSEQLINNQAILSLLMQQADELFQSKPWEQGATEPAGPGPFTPPPTPQLDDEEPF